MSNISRIRTCHCSTRLAGASISSLRTRPDESSGVRMRPASIVLPSPTSSATSHRVGHDSSTRLQTQSWCGSKSMRDREKTPQASLTELNALPEDAGDDMQRGIEPTGGHPIR